MPFGLERGAVVRDPSELAAVAQEWAAPGFDVVLDLVGGAYTPASVALLATRGRLMLVGLVAGASATFDLRRILSRRVTITGTVLRARSIDEKAAATHAFARDLLARFETGVLRPVVDRVFPLAEIADAHRRIESNESFGKVVVVPYCERQPRAPTQAVGNAHIRPLACTTCTRWRASRHPRKAFRRARASYW
jgi:NADPH:quinone reductase-like Zn-dependent oxidoreductase